MNHYCILGMQFGSEAKGALAGYLALERHPDVCISNWSPNAGHTFRSGKFKLVRQMLPLGSISPKCHTLLLGPGSVIDIDMLMAEAPTAINQKIIIHPNAAVVSPHNRAAEVEKMADGHSTKKGVGEAMAERLLRYRGTPGTIGDLFPSGIIDNQITVNAKDYNTVLRNAKLIQVEGCQGFSLSIYSGFYPYTTSRDCSVHQLKADVMWPGALPLDVFGAVRPWPIRIAGDSGPVYGDQQETTWDALGVEPEITTVTKKVRRVFSFSRQQLFEACSINNPTALYLSFCDYFQDEDNLEADIIGFLEEELQVPVWWQSYGPDFKDMVVAGTNPDGRL